jgi:alginate O-acetyltransferase complex protein AlgI
LAFNSLIFLFIFFPLFILIYYSVNSRLQNYWILVFSLLFYSWGSPKVIFYLLLLSIFDYLITKYLNKINYNLELKKVLIALSICANIFLLGYFKYKNLFIHEINSIISCLGFTTFTCTSIVLPIGISFITFKKISYIMDIYWEKIKPAETMSDFLVYIFLFPQIMAGPIVIYHEISEQIKLRKHSIELFYEGIFRFSIGLGKKVLIADSVGEIANKLFMIPSESLPVLYIWLAAICFTFQIYFDFSGYSDMAIGIGNMIGFTCPENFNAPYISQTVTEFWRRWHITLSSWMREYLYIPLGGNRVSTFRNYSNLWIVFLISGLWHGANWTFVIWGGYYGFFLTIDKLFWYKKSLSINKLLNITITFLIILFGWVLFRSPDLQYAIKYYMRMFGLLNYCPAFPPIIWQELITNRAMTVLVIAIVLSFIPASKLYERFYFYFMNSFSSILIHGAKIIIALIVVFLAVVSLSNSSFNAFIYFRF